MDGQSIEHFPLGYVGGQVTDQSAFGGVFSGLFDFASDLDTDIIGLIALAVAVAAVFIAAKL
jgi:hypothetical protein